METEKVYRDIVIAAFKKAEEEYVNDKKYKLSEYIADQIEEKSNIRITSRTFVHYYEKYINKKEGIATPKHENIEHLCVFLGYDSYEDYVNQNPEEAIIQTPPKEYFPKRDKNRIAIWTLVITIVGLTLYNQITSNLISNECMIWVTDHYEPIKCSGKRGETALDQETLEGMKQIDLCKDDTFFLPNDEPIVWYDKHHNKLTFFTKEGIHPTNGRTLKPITQYIINKYAQECGSKYSKE